MLASTAIINEWDAKQTGLTDVGQFLPHTVAVAFSIAGFPQTETVEVTKRDLGRPAQRVRNVRRVEYSTHLAEKTDTIILVASSMSTVDTYIILLYILRVITKLAIGRYRLNKPTATSLE